MTSSQVMTFLVTPNESFGKNFEKTEIYNVEYFLFVCLDNVNLAFGM